MDADRENVLKGLLQPLLRQSIVPHAADSPAETADMVCPRCHRFFTWSGMQLDAAGFHLICRDCRTAEATAARKRRPLRLLRHPGVYVVLIVLTAGLLWLGGAGRIDPDELKEADKQRPWYLQEYAGLILERAGAAKRRTDFLVAEERTDAIPRWAELGEASFRELAELWRETPAKPDLLLGAALMRAARGENRQAYAEAAALTGHYGERSPVYPGYHFICGRLALAAGDKNAARKHLERVLGAAAQPRDLVAAAGRLMGVAHALSDDPQAYMKREKVWLAVGLPSMPMGLLEPTLELMADHRIASKMAAEIETELGRNVSVPNDGEDAPDLVIEDLED